MSFLQTLRNTPWLARLALLWFALTLGAALASPLVNPQSEVLICSAASGMVKIVLNADGSTNSAPAALDCPLCMVGNAPPSAIFSQPEPVLFQGRELQGRPADIVAATTAAPPPARGPPASH